MVFVWNIGKSIIWLFIFPLYFTIVWYVCTQFMFVGMFYISNKHACISLCKPFHVAIDVYLPKHHHLSWCFEERRKKIYMQWNMLAQSESYWNKNPGIIWKIKWIYIDYVWCTDYFVANCDYDFNLQFAMCICIILINNCCLVIAIYLWIKYI